MIELSPVAHARLVRRLSLGGCTNALGEARLLCEAASSPAQLETMVVRRITDDEPLEHILGWVDWAGLRLAIVPGVFVPRPRTQFLARTVCGTCGPDATVLDLCCGCGALGAAVIGALPRVVLLATDIDPRAVALARDNLPAGAQVYCGNLFQALPGRLRGRLDVIVANAPYVPTDSIRTLPGQFRHHEPAIAHDGGPDGLAVHRRIVAASGRWLAPAGRVFLECATTQATALAGVVARAGLGVDVCTDPEEDVAVVMGSAP